MIMLPLCFWKHTLDNFILYSFVQEGYLYSEYGQELDYIENIRKMNEQLLTLDKNDRKGE